jgi:hypothetical protein
VEGDNPMGKSAQNERANPVGDSPQAVTHSIMSWKNVSRFSGTSSIIIG